MLETEVLDSPATTDEVAAPTAASSEAPASLDASAADLGSVSTDVPAADRPRDANGRFLKRDGSPVAPDEQASLEASTQSPATTAPVAPLASVPAGEPFVFRADGQKIPIPGSMLTADGSLSIPPDQVPVIRQLLAEGVAHRGSWRQKEAEYQRQVTEAGAVEKAKADRYNAAALLLFDKMHDPAWLEELVADPQRTLNYMRRDVDYLLKEATLKAPQVTRQQQQAAPEPDDAQTEQAFASALAEELDDLMDDPTVKALFAAEDRTEVHEAFRERMAAYAAMLEDGLKIDLHKLKKDFQREVGLQRKAKQAALDAQKAAEFNAQRKPAVNAPPVISTRGPGSSGAVNRTFKTREEYNKAMGLN